MFHYIVASCILFDQDNLYYFFTNLYLLLFNAYN